MPTLRCPRCRAAVPADASWCGQCYATLAVPAPPPPPPSSVQPASPPTPPQPVAGPTWPCSRCGERNEVRLDQCAACAAPFLADVEDTTLVLPGLGPVGGMTNGRRVAVSVGGAVAVTALLVAVLAIAGALL